jgi:hypothetical protein
MFVSSLASLPAALGLTTLRRVAIVLHLRPRETCESGALRVCEQRRYTVAVHVGGLIASSEMTGRAYDDGGRTVHHLATSPPLTSPHARPLVSARHPSQRQPRSSQTLRPAALSTACQPDAPFGDPRQCCTSTVVCRKRRSRAALRASEGLCHSARSEHTPPCLQWDGAWLGVQCHRVHT